ncbi:hypothetical protein BS47DRAFT_1369650 [Hydnum rufescens UP504]|uniref:Bromo domain-containing protein n=1 Tax=Hydnum rufescens UP504 TaxID=1448309 RepID=A0A9P6ACL3_9AGAM|nr:hypothetical protein BS47DRAFT_1369650 [Hydnum rufescens UP504]
MPKEQLLLLFWRHYIATLPKCVEPRPDIKPNGHGIGDVEMTDESAMDVSMAPISFKTTPFVKGSLLAKAALDTVPLNPPVDYIALGIPHYPKIIRHPIDLSTVDKKFSASNPSIPNPGSRHLWVSLDHEGHCIMFDRQTPAPARTDDDNTREKEVPHTCCRHRIALNRQTHMNPPHVSDPTTTMLGKRRYHTCCGGCGHCITLNQQTRMNPTTAPARTNNDNTGVQYGRVRSHTRPQRSTICHQYNKASNMVPHTRFGRDKPYGEIQSAQPPRPQSPSSKYQRAIRRQRIRYGTTHPLLRVPSLSENPPNEDTDESPTQILMRSHPSPECPAPEHDDRLHLIPHTCCSRCGNHCVLSSVLSIHKTPRQEHTRRNTQPPATQYEHPIKTRTNPA